MQYRRKSTRPRYRVIGGKPSVELKLKTPRQLFDERDPAPFRERDLDDDAARYIVSSFEELSGQRDVSIGGYLLGAGLMPDRAVKLSLYFESLGELVDNPREIERAIHAFFRFEGEMKRRELHDTFRQGVISLGIGLLFLFICTAFAHHFQGAQSLWKSMMYEGLFIMGWVSMWKPISIFLYDWWPIFEDMTTYRRLASIEVEIAPLRPELLKTEATSVATTPIASSVPASVQASIPTSTNLAPPAEPKLTILPSVGAGIAN